MSPISFDDFLKVDIRVGKILEVEDFLEAKKPSYKLRIDFGPKLGVKRSSAQLTHYYRKELVGKLVLAVVNFPPKQVANFMSEVLVLGVPDVHEQAILLVPDRSVPLGGRLY